MTGGISSRRANLIPARIPRALTDVYGDRMEPVVFFGSLAGGAAQPDSDYDVVIFLNGMNGTTDRRADRS
jgi:predicted nucleotidyltransferase